ncbi:hypothetical protein EUTSA_v10019746mg [Eutrema salsugineum]|uniref:DUF1985 domain-containing protein n=1 Tax=Eutrema salsugineum TaxID=72664 RepID=V4KIS5_EUTSA|nr:uncharacterized protein LOC18009306 [Eutrema salsugineum]ESQ27148.1 hypothetical protein EUTSA_v10019746mg [Eutrema salsugineum]
MASASGSKDYPQRLYPEGKSPLLKKSCHHNCKLHEFIMMIRDHLGEEIYNDIMNNSQVGVLLKLALTSFIWSAKTVQYFVSNQLKVNRNHEFWTLIGGRPVRFSLLEYAEITGLNCYAIDPNDKLEIDHTEFWAEIGVRGGEGPNWNELKAQMKTCQAWNFEKKKMLALLFILHVGVLGLHRNSRIPLALAKTVMDEAAFERQPWGHYGFHELIYSIKIANLGGAQYTLHGCVQAMLVWGYECIPILAERAGKIRPDVDDSVVPLLRWTSSRCRYVFETLLEMDKSETEDHKVRVRHLMVVKPLEEIYPVWEGEPRRVDVDIKVHNMICDILDGSLDEGFWESPKNVDGDATVQTPKQSKRKLETPRVEKKKKEKMKEAEATDSTPRSKRRREREARKDNNS